MSTETERIIALDPGERTGWAAGVWDPQAGQLGELRQGVATLKDMAMALGDRIHTYDTVIYETWRLYPHMARAMTGNDFQPVQLVGIIRFLSWQHPHIKLVSQGANIKDTALKTMPKELADRFKRSSEQHDKDALMHLWHYIWRTRIDGNEKQPVIAA